MTKEKGFDPNKKIITLKGEEYPKSFPTQKELNKLPKIKRSDRPKEQWAPDIEKLEKETVGNVILNCLARYMSKSRKEGFYVNMVAQAVIAGMNENRRVNLKDKLLRFLMDVLDEQTMNEGEKDKDSKAPPKVKGLYIGWVIAQVFQELGIEEDN